MLHTITLKDAQARLSVAELRDEKIQFNPIPFPSDRLASAQAVLKQVMNYQFNPEIINAESGWRNMLANTVPRFPLDKNPFKAATAFFQAKKALADFNAKEDKDESEMVIDEKEKQKKAKLENDLTEAKKNYTDTLTEKDFMFMFHLFTSRMSGLLEHVRKQLIVDANGVINEKMLKRIKEMAHIWNYNQLRIENIKNALHKIEKRLKAEPDPSKISEYKEIIDLLYRHLNKKPDLSSSIEYKVIMARLCKLLDNELDLANLDVYLQIIDQYFKRMKKLPMLSSEAVYTQIIKQLLEQIISQSVKHALKQVQAQLNQPMKFMDDEHGKKGITFAKYYKIKLALPKKDLITINAIIRAINKIDGQNPPPFLLSDSEDLYTWSSSDAQNFWGFTKAQLDNIFCWKNPGKSHRVYLTKDLLAARIATPWTKFMSNKNGEAMPTTSITDTSVLADLQQNLPEVLQMMLSIKDSDIYFDESNVDERQNMRWEMIRKCCTPDGKFLIDKFKKLYPRASLPSKYSFALDPKQTTGRSESLATSSGSGSGSGSGLAVAVQAVQPPLGQVAAPPASAYSLPINFVPSLSTTQSSASLGEVALSPFSFSQPAQMQSAPAQSNSHSHALRALAVSADAIYAPHSHQPNGSASLSSASSAMPVAAHKPAVSQVSDSMHPLPPLLMSHSPAPLPDLFPMHELAIERDESKDAPQHQSQSATSPRVTESDPRLGGGLGLKGRGHVASQAAGQNTVQRKPKGRVTEHVVLAATFFAERARQEQASSMRIDKRDESGDAIMTPAPKSR